MKSLLYVLLVGCLSQRMMIFPNVEQPQMLIQEKEIQSMYGEEVVLDIQLPTTFTIEDIQVVRKAKGVADKVESIHWTLKDRRWQTKIVVDEGEDMQYVLYDVDQQKTVYTSQVFCVDTTKPQLHIEWREKAISTLPDAFASSGWIAFYFTDTNLDTPTVNIAMLEDGIQISPVIRENKIYYHIKEGHTYIVNASAKDEAGHYTEYTNMASPLTIDSSPPKVWLRINDQICTERQYQLFQPEQLTVYVEDEHFLATQSHVYVNEEEITSQWEPYKQGWKKTWMCEQSGHYEIRYDIVDMAGNRTNKKAMQIMQDLDVPKIKMMANEVGIQDLPNVFNQKQDIVWYIQEANLDEIESFFMLDDKQIPFDKVDATTYRISFSILQGKHTIQAMFKDKGGTFCCVSKRYTCR